MKPQYETYRYVGEICRLKSQSIVECRLPGTEISGVLALQATAVPTECGCTDGEVHYGGKVAVRNGVRSFSTKRKGKTLRLLVLPRRYFQRKTLLIVEKARDYT